MTLCPICNSSSLYYFLEQKSIPVHQNMIFRKQSEAQDIPRGDLKMAACEDCTFVFNAEFDEQKTSYDQNYDNSQCYSHYFDSHQNKMAEKILGQHSSGQGVIVEVGCGKGDFLKKLVDTPGVDFRAYGFDPTYVGPDTERNGKIKFEKKFYDENCSAIEADIVVCRHVIEHVKKPKDLLNAVVQGLKNSPQAKVFFETPDVTWIFENKVIWDFFYEHCSLFTPQSITRAFIESGFEITKVETVFEGQYLWAKSTPGSSPSSGKQQDTRSFISKVKDYQKTYTHQKEKLFETLTKLKKKGPVSLWGAGAKGVTLANMIDPEGTLIDSIIDINPNKQNGFIAGTGHKIIGVPDIVSRGIASAMIMNPNYRKEIEQDLKSRDIEIELINWS